MQSAPGSRTASQDTRQIARAAGTVMLAFALGQVVGLLRTILVSGAFGTGSELDAFWAANQVPETLFNLIAGGALGSAFIPVFTHLIARRENAGAWKLASSIANLVLAVMAGLCLLSALFAPIIVRYALASGFAGNPAQEALAIHLLRILLPAAAVFAISGLVMGILNAHQIFLIPALAPSMYPLGIIMGLLLFKKTLGIDSLAVGVLAGSVLHLGVQIPTLLRLRPQYRPSFGLQEPLVREVGRLMAPRLFGVAVVRLNFWVNTLLASYLATGSITAITAGFQLMMMPQAAIAQSIATASLPTFSAQAAEGRLDKMRSSLAASLRGVILLAAPASAGLILLSTPVVSLLLERGVFDVRSTRLVSWALIWYAAGLVGHSVVEITSRAFYALHDTKTPVKVGAAAMALNILLSIALIPLFRTAGWEPLGGIALANSTATGLEMLALLVIMRRRLSGLEELSLFSSLAQAGAGVLGMVLVLAVWNSLTSAAPVWLAALGGIALGVAVYIAILYILRVSELRSLIRIVSNQARRRRSRRTLRQE